MKLRTSALLATLVVLMITSCSRTNPTSSPVDFVNPYMGNISHLLVPTYPTIHLPNSMLRVYPERADYTTDHLKGLPLVVTSHRGSSAFNLSPLQGDLISTKPVVNYSYDHEKITPYSYEVVLDEQEIKVRFAPSHQSAIYELNFEQEQPIQLLLNSRNGVMQWTGNALVGSQILSNNTSVYIYLETNIKPERISAFENGDIVEQTLKEGHNACLALSFPAKEKSIQIRYGISFIDTDQARKNLQREIPDYDLNKVEETAKAIWIEALSKIQVDGGTANDRTIFYTSLYRTYERPVCISEDGRYFSAFDGQVHNDEGHPFYTDDWIWDSFRAAHPLRILVDPEIEENILHSFVEMAHQMDQNWMPTFPEITGDSRRMNSNHAVASVLDAHAKGLSGFDLEAAYISCKNGIVEKTLAPWSGMPAGELDQFYKDHGYIPALGNDEQETIPEVHSFEGRQPVAVTLGTSFDEWCLSQIAKALGHIDDAEYFLNQSNNYRNLFNPETSFFHPKDKNGKFIEPFDYRYSGGMGARKYYDENNGWTYRWDVQHNIPDLIQLMGGKEQFVANLDATFSEPLGRSKFEFYAQLPDQTGNVGQFTMANEPSLHIPYLYNYAGEPWKTQKRIRSLINTWFRNDLMGVPGDEDGGGMSSFVVFSQMGFYPVTPGLPLYTIGSPFFNQVSIILANGKTFEIIANNNSAENKYIQSATLNGEPITQCWFTHEQLMNGGKLVLEMGSKANKNWGINPYPVQ